MISGIIDANPTICEHILQDLNRGKSESQRAGAKGMNADQGLRCIVVKILFGFTYEDLAFHEVSVPCLKNILQKIQNLLRFTAMSAIVHHPFKNVDFQTIFKGENF